TLGTNLSLINTKDGYEIPVNPPLEAGKFLEVPKTDSLSTSGKEVLFYRLSYDYRSTLKIIPSSGGSPTESGRELTLWAYTQSWTPDNKVVITGGEDSNGKFTFWAIPFNGGRPIMVDIKIPEIEKPIPYDLSPDCKKLLFSVEKGKNSEELWVAQFSTDCYHVTEPATMIYIWEDRHPAEEASWSPDGTRVSIMHHGEIWILPVDGSPPYQLTKSPGWKYNPVWSPDGQMIAYNLFLPDRKGGIYIIPALGGEEREVLGTPGSYRSNYIFSKNGKELFVINHELLIVGISVADGESRKIADLKEFDINQAHSLCISPDVTKLACVGWNRPKDESGAIFIVSVQGGKVQKLASEDTGYKESITWSPNGQWISYCCDVSVKTRPQGIIWKTNLEEVIKKKRKT
ncbi:hypothetical protein FJZ33_13240, partial [Candidatus Poribacteria bacterium]|nr:hypothetical protein [Candidatus Poribacteria bacterium]